MAASKPKTTSELRSELSKLTKERAAGEVQLQKLADAYDDFLLNGELDDVTANVHGQAQERARAAMCDARIREVQKALDAGDQRAEQERRLTIYRAASGLRAEVETALADYNKLAPQIVSALARIGRAKAQVLSANRELPAGYDLIPDPEPSNGREPIPAKRGWLGGVQASVPGFGHVSILDRVRLGHPTDRSRMYFPPGATS